MAILEVHGLKKSFGSHEVLKGIDFELQKGEVLAIIGSSGSGKTTLLRCLNFLETADGGKIVVNGDHQHQARGGAPGQGKEPQGMRDDRRLGKARKGGDHLPAQSGDRGTESGESAENGV